VKERINFWVVNLLWYAHRFFQLKPKLVLLKAAKPKDSRKTSYTTFISRKVNIFMKYFIFSVRKCSETFVYSLRTDGLEIERPSRLNSAGTMMRASILFLCGRVAEGNLTSSCKRLSPTEFQRSQRDMTTLL
jgi:hypothetical protein